MKKLIIGFSKPRGGFKPFAWLIELIGGTPYSHVYIRAHSESLDVDLIYQASGAQVNFMGLGNFLNHARTIYEFEADVEDAKYRGFMRWAIINSGASYSLKQVLGILYVKMFNLKSNPFPGGRGAWVCSELAGYVLGTFLDTAMSEELDIVTPKQIFDICKKHLKQIEVQ